MSPTDHAELFALWGNASEVVLGVQGESIWMRPSDKDAPKGPAFPSLLLENSLFAVTAFDPPGMTRSLEDNAEMNGQLWDKLRVLQAPAPKHVYRSFGFSLTESWREDGFVIVFDNAQLDAARAAIVGIAKEFQQGAIFEYTASEAGECYLRRTTVPALSDEVAEEALMQRVVQPAEGNPLLQRAWAGPAEAGQ